ncbi:MAG: 4-phosphoerythronate dehydrogenase [Prevotellaceae bacterium]|nr:4-phosphoerythronate dehydrogenase [Candidatus Colivivens equi]
MKAVIDDKIPFIKGTIERIVPNTVYISGSEIKAKDVRDADILVIRTRTHCNQHLLEGSKVRLIITATIGYDHIDIEWCRQHGVEWHNCPGCNANSVATYIKNTLIYIREKKVHDITTIGIVGVGHVGSIVARNAVEAGLKVVCHDPFKDFTKCDLPLKNVSLEELGSKADIITFHVPLTYDGPEPTFHIADKKFFSHLNQQPVIVNTSRGGVVNEMTLIEAIDKGIVHSAIIDTWENEPNINADLLNKAIIATPHIAGYSQNGKFVATKMALQTISHFLNVPDTPIINDFNCDNYQKLSVETLCDDSFQLKKHPECFEYFRNNYPKRIE